MSKTNPYSHLTAIERANLSFPAKFLLKHDRLFGDILDFGCGFGKDVEILNGKGYNIEGYDPHYFPVLKGKQYDTFFCFYVLNVLEQEQQINVLMDASKKLKLGGKAYFAVRSDLKHQGFRTHKVHQVQTF